MATYTLDRGDFTLLLDDSGPSGYDTVLLANARTYVAQRYYCIKKIGTTSTVTINTSDGQTIDGETSIEIKNTFDGVIISTDGTAFYVMGWIPANGLSSEDALDITTASYTANDDYKYLTRDTDSYGSLEIQLPAISSFTLPSLTVSKTGFAGYVKITGYNAETVDETSSIYLYDRGESVTIKPLLDNWRIL